MRHFFCDSLKRFFVACALTVVGIFSATAANLPSGYTELEYIESTGTQYIDTGIKANQNTKAELSFKFDQYSGASEYGNLFGWRAGQNQNAFLCGTTDGYINQSSSKLFCQFDSVSPTIINPVPIDLNQHTLELSSDGFYVDNVLYRSYPNASAFTTTENITLFAMYSTPTEFVYGKFIAYSFKIWDGNALIRDFVPAKNSSGVIGMYDTVRNEFYTNAGTGTFTAGPTACPGGTLETRHESGLPAGYTLVNGLTNASGAWFDTGIKDDVDDMEYEVRVAPQTGSWYILQSRAYSGGPIYGIAGSLTGNTITFSAGNGISLASSIARYAGRTVYVRGYHRNGVGYLYVKDETANIEDTKNGTYNTNSYVPATSNIGVFGNGVDNVAASTVVYSVRLWKNGVLVADYVPVKDSNNVAGFYDLVSETFKTPTRGSVTAGNEVSDPIVEQCVAGGIRIATTKYTEDAFAGLMTTLSEAITKVTNIVDTTVQQATEIGNLATTKQDRPDTDCPAGRKCLLIMGADNKPHWYLIQE